MTTSTRSSSNTNSNNNHNNDREERTSASTTTYNHHSPTGSESGTPGATIGSTSRVMQADEDFNIRFVNLVRTHKCLYDKKVPEYRNRDNQEKAWVLISKETRESVIHCKERWRNLRACLSRYIKQQYGSEPQHKPYYLTEHMAFLLPFLKSSRNSLEGNNSLATLYQMSQQHLHHHQPHLLHPAIHAHEEHKYCATTNNNNNNISNNSENMEEALEMKYSISEKDDEETIDAFDPAVTNTLGLKHLSSTPTHSTHAHQRGGGDSPARSDTASADSMKNFIPDVQLAETGSQLIYNDSGRGTPPPLHYHPHSHPHPHPHPLALAMDHHPASFEPGTKRIKTECEATSTMTNAGGFYGGLSSSELADMEFFRSILPDLAALTPQQRRKFKIGILELIDDVVTRYPAQEHCNGGGPANVVNGSGGSSNGGSVKHQRRSSGRDWRKQ
ncbi:uncharacterized protein LOC108042893 [Drosophila rhopaloa]|uniref:Uncharacterized protein LOC108042893 n=1 Tax=Drosophila rhopaloa TaxID=1041015 RepID=A0A6P4EUU5_DRORH|nr:uncharacterized protein LOC108042893 [Drosophila rhopaloa]XP_016976872.1 uncharacterized protein LOC108042893 [Drosophila rhopaloa]